MSRESLFLSVSRMKCEEEMIRLDHICNKRFWEY